MNASELVWRDVDKRVYEEEISPWLPDRVIDCHVHLGLIDHWREVSPERRREIWALDLDMHHTWETFEHNLSMLFPARDVFGLVFGYVYREVEVERDNAYIATGMTQCGNCAGALMVTRPEWDPDAIAEAFSNGFIGIKPYPDLAAVGMNDASIYDFLPREHLSVLNEMGGVLMLHLPRPGRLADPDNIRELLELNDRYPAVKVIVAHIGRAYCLETAKQGIPHFADRPGIFFDTAANLNSDVFEFAVESLGPERVLYGSDLPVMLMRGVREHVGDKYINYTDGAFSWNTNRKSLREEANYTYYIYEEIRAIIRALRNLGLGREAMEKIMYSNSARLLGRVAHGYVNPALSLGE